MIDPASIDRWLSREVRSNPDFKALSDRQCQALIEAKTGRPLNLTQKIPLWPHQFRAICAALYLERSLCFLGMRTGKTRVVLEWCSHLRLTGLWRGTGIVIAPSPTALGPWRLQIPEYSGFRAIVARSTNPDAFANALDQKPDLIVTCWSVLQRMLTVKKHVKVKGKDQYKNKFVFDAELAMILGDCFTLSVVDEIHYCKNPTALTTKLGVALTANHKYKLGLTGTPFGRHPFDLWAQGYIIDGGQTLSTSYYFFQQAFGHTSPARWRGKDATELVFDKTKLPILSNKLRTFSIAYELEEIRKLAEHRKLIELDMIGEQRALYNALLRARVEQAVVGERTISNLFIRLRQLSAGQDHWIDDNGKDVVSILPEHAKLAWLRECISAGRFSKQQCVLFYNFTLSGKQVVHELRRAGITTEWLHGAVFSGRDEMVARFQAGKSAVFVANVASGAEAIDLSAADIVTFYEAPVSPTKRQQAERRPMAASRGSRPLIIEDVVCSPVERRVLQFTQEGRAMLKKGVYSGRQLYDMLAAAPLRSTRKRL